MRKLGQLTFGIASILSLASAVLAEDATLKHPQTSNAKGTRLLQSSPVSQSRDGDASQRHIGHNIYLVDASGTILSTCFLRNETVIESVKYPTKASWNKSESMVAVTTGGRTWRNLFFFSVSANQIRQLPEPEWSAFLPPTRSGGVSEPMRMYQEFIRWIDEDTCIVRIWGNSYIGSGAKTMGDQADYVDYDARITLTVTADEIVVHYVEQEPPGL